MKVIKELLPFSLFAAVIFAAVTYPAYAIQTFNLYIVVGECEPEYDVVIKLDPVDKKAYYWQYQSSTMDHGTRLINMVGSRV